MIAERVGRGRARRTCYLSLQTVTSADELREALTLVLDLWLDEQGPRLIVLDELTFVRDWARTIVYLREHVAEFREATVILTGSSAVDLASSADVLHGRRGRWKKPLDRLHMPMTFRDYAMARMRSAADLPILPLAELLSPDGRRKILETSLMTDRLDRYLDEYLHSGGLPTPVADMLADGMVSETTTMELWRGLATDVRRLSRNDLVLRKLLSRVVVALGSMTDSATLARELDVSRPTAASYIDVMGASFALIALHQPDPKRRSEPALRRPRKLYLGDLALAAIPGILGGPAAGLGGLVENAIAIAVLRHVEGHALERFVHPDQLYYWRSADGREVDFLVGDDERMAIESRYTERPRGKDYESLDKAFGQGVMVSRRLVDVDRAVITVPAGVFLALLG
jgi:predicted AAA+ superfamily ATPase